MEQITSMITPYPEDSEKYEVSTGSSVSDDVTDLFYLTVNNVDYNDMGMYVCQTYYRYRRLGGEVTVYVRGTKHGSFYNHLQVEGVVHAERLHLWFRMQYIVF